MEIYNNISVGERDRIINGSVRIFTQHYCEADGRYSNSCYHLDKGQIYIFTPEGIDITYKYDMEDNAGINDSVELHQATTINLKIIKRW